MAALNDAPCRVSADLRRYQREQEQRALDVDEFDAHDDKKVIDTVGRELAKPVQGLLLTLQQIEQAERIGGLNKERALEWLREDLEKLRLGCLERWEQL